jgi:hypothetical protein
MPRRPTIDNTVLMAALQGLEQQRLELEKNIVTVRNLLGARKPAAAAAPVPAKRKRVLSGAARKRISEAQKRRWALAKAKSAAKAAKKAARASGA